MATTQNFTIDQGTDVKINFTVKRLTNEDLPYNANTNPYIPIDITGSTIRLMARTSYDSSVATLDLSTTNGKFIITNGTLGTFRLVLVPADTTAVLFKGESLDLVYDLEITDTTPKTTRAFQGVITINRESTR